MLNIQLRIGNKLWKITKLRRKGWMDMLSLTALMDNKPTEHKALIAEHGLSLHVQYGDCRLLFDCGSGANPLRNAHRLGVDLKDLDAVILSHSHYDHAAGFRDLTESGLGSRDLYTGPNFFEAKYAKNGVRFTNLACGFDRDFLKTHQICHHEIQGLQEIYPGVWLISGFPRIHSFETIPERFVRRTDSGFVADDFGDEVCMALDVEDGLVVLVGCSHPGILNMMTQVSALLKKPIRAVFGGTHLVEADAQRIDATVCRLQEMGLEILGLSHCSGDAADCAICARTDIQGCHLGTGDCVFFD